MKRILTGLFAVVALGTMACGGEAEQTPSELGLAAGAAKNEAKDEGKSLSRFVGTWSASGTTATQITLPQGVYDVTSPESETVSVREGEGSDLVFIIGDCAYPANVTGDVAKFESGFACDGTVDGYHIGTLVKSGVAKWDEGSMDLNLSGSLTLVANGGTHPGTWNVDYSMTKVSK